MKEYIFGTVLGIKATLQAIKDMRKDAKKKHDAVKEETTADEEPSKNDDFTKTVKNKKPILIGGLIVLAFVAGFRRGVYHANFKLGKAVADVIEGLDITRF